MRRLIFSLLLIFFAQALFAQDLTEEADGITATNELILEVTTQPAAKIIFTKRFIFPFLQGESSLTEDNNINLALSAEISPVSLNGIVEAVWTPIAFFQVTAGGRIGSGWILNLSEKKYGIGINRQKNGTLQSEASGSSFDGLLWKVQTGLVLQGDVGAVFPGDWNHIVFRSCHEINYSGYSRAGAGDSWFYEDDYGENCNGFNYYGNFLIGYQMPLFFNLVAILTEMDLYLYDLPNRSKWGDDKIRWTFSAVLGFTILEKFDLMVTAQFITMRNYTDANWENLYYRNRTLNTASPLHLEFYRVAAILTYKF